MRCHSVQALWASTPPAHHVVAMVAAHNPPSLWTGGSCGDIIVWKLPSRPPDASNQDLLPMALLSGHTASIVSLVTCGLDEMKRTGSYATPISMMNREFCEPNACELIVSVCCDGWLCVWDCLTRRCRRRRKLPPWVGSPNSMTPLLGTKRYVAIACDGCNTGSSRINGTDEADNNMKKLVDNARTMAWENFGSTNITVVIVDTSVLGVVRVVCTGLFGLATVRAIAAVPDADSLHKIIISDPAGHIQMWEVSLEGEEMVRAAAGEPDKHVTVLPLQDKTDFGVDAKTVCFSSNGSYLLLVFGTKWVIVSTQDQSVVHQCSKGESKHGNAEWTGGLFFLESGIPGCMLLIWDANGGATVFTLKTTSERLATEEVCWIPPYQTDHKLLFCFKYHQFFNSLLCVACGHISLPTPDVSVRLWLLPRSFMRFSGMHTTDHIDNGVLGKQVSCTLYAHGNLRTPWANLASSCVISGESADKKGMHVHNLHEESVSCSFGTEWVTASMVLVNEAAIPRALVLGFSNGVIKLICFQTSLQEGERGLLVDNGITQDLYKHSGPITCLAEHKMSIASSGTHKYLLSGGMDCLTCIWNLTNGGQLLMTLHHHVTPVHQILLPPTGTYTPWANCFITVGKDGCIALISLETLQVERMFVGHPGQPKQIAWDGIRGYLSCLCSSISTPLNGIDVLFMWDMKSGALERILRGPAAHSMYTNFAQQLQGSTLANGLSKIQASSTSSLLHAEVDPALTQAADNSQTLGPNLRRKTGDTIPVSNSKQSTDEKILRHEISSSRMIGGLEKLSSRLSQALNQGTKASWSEAKDSSFGIPLESSSRNLFHKQPPIKGASPIAGAVALQFDLFTLMAPDLGRMGKSERESEHSKVQAGNKVSGYSRSEDTILLDESLALKPIKSEIASSLGSTEGCLLRSSLAFLHLWGADKDLDKCLREEWQIVEPSSVHTAAGFAGDKGATTLLLPGWESTFEMWTLSAEFCALRSLTLVATALRMATLCRHTSNANSALAAFYTRGLAELFPKVKAPSLELYACFWQDPSEHVRMAARSLFHCAVSRAIPPVLRARGSPEASPDESGHMEHGYINTADSLLRLEQKLVTEGAHEKPTWPESISPSAEIIDWLESYESQPWTEVVEGTSQDARAGRTIVASALAVWYPGLVKPELAPSVAPYLVKLVKAMVDRHSAVAAELLGEGMESVWRHLIADEIQQLICDVFLLVECLSGGGTTKPTLVSNPATAMAIRETLTGSLLPSLAMANVATFLQIMQTQLSSASTSSSVPLVTLMTTIRIIRGAPRVAVFHLSEVMSIILQTMNTGRHCHQTAMAAIREMVRVYPMVALHQSSGKLAVGDAAGDVHSLAIHVYDLNSATKLRDLDASGPPGHPALLLTNADGSLDAGGISALAFSEDGEGVVAFSQHGLMIRWWSLSAVWWEKLSRVHPPLQCNKLVLVPPWSGFSPKSSRSSIMATISNNSDMHPTIEESRWHQHEDTIARADNRSIDLSFKIEWRAGRRIALLHHSQELGVFQL